MQKIHPLTCEILSLWETRIEGVKNLIYSYQLANYTGRILSKIPAEKIIQWKLGH